MKQIMIPRKPFALIVEAEIRKRATEDADGSGQLCLELEAGSDRRYDSWYRRLRDIRGAQVKSKSSGKWYVQSEVSLDVVDEFLQALDLTHLWQVPPLSRHAPKPEKALPGRPGVPRRFDFTNQKMNERQLRELHAIHIDHGYSVRDLCRRGWKSWGYASERSALNSVLDRWQRLGLKPRTQAEATAAANALRRQRPLDETKTQYKRRKRRELYAQDPAAHAAALERIRYVRQHGHFPRAQDAA